MLQCRNYCKSISLPLMVFTRLCLDRQDLIRECKRFLYFFIISRAKLTNIIDTCKRNVTKNFLKCNFMAYLHQKTPATDASRHVFHFSYCVASAICLFIFSIFHTQWYKPNSLLYIPANKFGLSQLMYIHHNPLFWRGKRYAVSIYP